MNKMPTVDDLHFHPFTYAPPPGATDRDGKPLEYPPLNCACCNGPVGLGYKAEVPIGEGYETPLAIIVCSPKCMSELIIEKPGRTTAFLAREIGRLRREFPNTKQPG